MSSRPAARRERVAFRGGTGQQLSGALDVPAGSIRATALIAHCFTCDSRSRAAARVSRALVEAGYAVLRFDFTGLGESEGSFGDTTFTTNLDDLRAAATWLGEQLEAPQLLLGHSLGGASVLAVAGEMESVRAVAVIGAPSRPDHVGALIEDATPAEDGHLTVEVGGRRLHIAAGLADDLADQPQRQRIERLGKPLLVLHSPTDTVVGVEEARTIFETARHPKSFIALDGADHLLLRPGDAEFAGGLVAAWAARYLVGDAEAQRPDEAGIDDPVEGVVVDEIDADSGYAHRARSGHHNWVVDEPRPVGGEDSGPGPYDLLLAALGACTSMTMRMYARRKGWDYPPARVTLRHTRIHARDCESCETSTGMVDELERHIELDAGVPEDHRTALLAIADRCPVHHTLTGEVSVVTTTGSLGDRSGAPRTDDAT